MSMTIDHQSVLDRIKNVRRQKGISQESIAYDLGIDYSTYGKIERGHISLTVDRLQRISEVLQVTVQELYGWNESRQDTVASVKDKEMLIRQYQTELDLTKRELELLQQQLKDKEKIIRLLENK